MALERSLPSMVTTMEALLPTDPMANVRLSSATQWTIFSQQHRLWLLQFYCEALAANGVSSSAPFKTSAPPPLLAVAQLFADVVQLF